METNLVRSEEISKTTLTSLKTVALLSSALSVVYTVLLASKAVKGPPGQEVDTFAVGLSVMLAVCFEAAKYSFMHAGFDLGKNLGNSKSKWFRIIGATLLTISICISILSIAATKQYIDDTSATTEKNVRGSEELEKEKKIKGLMANSVVLRENEKTLADISDKIASAKVRADSLMEEKQALLDAGMVSKASGIERTLSALSASIDATIEKREELVLLQQDEIQKIRESVQGEVSMAKTYGNTTVILAIVLEIVSLLSVAVYSFIGKTSTAKAETVENNVVVEVQKQKKEPKKEPKKIPVSKIQEVKEAQKVYAPFEHDWVLEALAGEKVTVESVRKAARCSQATAMKITKDIKSKQLQEHN